MFSLCNKNLILWHQLELIVNTQESELKMCSWPIIVIYILILYDKKIYVYIIL